MAVREGMVKLVSDLRLLTDTATLQYQVNGVDYWSDDQLQDILDDNVYVYSDAPLIAKRGMYAGSLEARDFYLSDRQAKNLELVIDTETASDTWRLQIVDSVGNVILTPYTYYPEQSLFRFTSDVGVSQTLYLRAFGFNLYLVASKVWEMKASHTVQLVEFKAGQTSVKENQEHQHCLNMAKLYKRKAGIKAVSTFMNGYDRSDRWITWGNNGRR